MNIQFDFTDRHAMIFGGTTGISLGIAKAFAKSGANVSVASRKQVNVDRAIAELGACAIGCVADVRIEESVAAALAYAFKEHGPIDVLISGAAGNFLAEVKSMSSNAFKAVVDIDLIGSFHVARKAYKYLRKPGANVIFITAPQGEIPMAYQAHVGAAKAGMDQFMRVLALEWGVDGIRVNAISPGPIEGTEGMRRLAPQGDAGDAQVRAIVPLGRMGTIRDIAYLAMFLGSDESGYVSGAVIPCDGGSQGMIGAMIAQAVDQGLIRSR